MLRDQIIDRLRAREGELRAKGIRHLSLFGSVARGEERADSDIDLAAEFDPTAEIGMIEYGALAGQLSELLRKRVDLVGEPARTARMQAEIERDRIVVY